MNSSISGLRVMEKTYLSRGFWRISLLIIALGALQALRADPFSPQFSSSYVIRGEEFTWSSADEDGYSYHTDYYTSTEGGTLSVSGPYGQGSEGAISGSNSANYTGRSISGYVYLSSLLVNEDYTLPADPNQTMSIGGETATFSGGSYTLTYNWDGTWTSSSSSNYSGPGGSYSSSSSSDSSGNSSSSTSTSTSQTYPADGSTTVLFGTSLPHVSTTVATQQNTATDSATATSTESSSSTTTVNYGNGTSSLTRTTSVYSDMSSGETYDYAVSGYDPAFGSFSASSTEAMPTGISRSGPAFRSNSINLWVNGSQVSWTSGEVGLETGLVTDSYDSGYFNITGDLPAFLQNQTVPVTVEYDGGSYSGTITGTPTAPVFAVSGLTINTSVQARWAFTWVIRGETFEWTSASVSGSTHTDSYVSAGGGTLSVGGDIEGSDASISGQNSASYTGKSINGYYYEGNVLIDETTTLPANPALTMTIGGQVATFTGGSTSVTYGDGGATSYYSSSETYAGAGGSYTTDSSSDSNGNSYSSSTLSQTESSNGSTMTVFGKTLGHVSSSSTTYNYNSSDYLGFNYSGGSGTSSQTYQNGAASYSRESSWNNYDVYSESSDTVSVSDPDFGSFSATSTDGSTPTSFVCSAALFARDYSDIWINGTMATWSHGDIDLNGNVNDYFDGGNVSISGNVVSLLNNRSANITVYYYGTSYPGTVTGSPAAPVFLVPGLDIQLADGTRTTPVFTAETLYVNGTPYVFVSGGNDSVGHYSDKYSHPSFGSLVIASSGYNTSSGAVTVSYNGLPYAGSYVGNGVFNVSGLTVSTSPMTGLPNGFWIRGRYYQREVETNLYRYFAPAPPVVVTGAGPVYTLSGSDTAGGFTGSYDSGASGLFLLTQEGAPIPAVAVNASGAMILSADEPPTGLPPAVKISGYEGLFVFLGSKSEDTLPSAQAAYYGRALVASVASENHWLLKIRNDGSGAVTFTDYATAANSVGSYLPVSHVFQTGVTDALPMPMTAVDAAGVLWSPLPLPTGLPPTFTLNGQVWRYTGSDSAGDHYVGYVTGQEMVVAAADEDGRRNITLTDPVGGNAAGKLNGPRGFADLGDGRIVYSGDYDGGRIPPAADPGVYVIAGEVDITGNVLSLGSRANDASVAGLSLTYSDINNAGSLQSAMNRAAAEWAWSRASNDSASATQVPMMKLDSNHRLSLFDAEGTPDATIVLDPGTASLSKMPMLELTHAPEAASAPANSVLTKGMADALYFRADVDGGAFGTNLITNGGQFVVGRNNVSSDDLFTVGAGADIEQRRNAFSITADGNAAINGNLAVTGTITMNGAALLTATQAEAEYLTIDAAEETYLDQTTADALYLKSATAAATYLTSSLAATTYLPVNDPLDLYLSQAEAEAEYLTKNDAAGLYVSTLDLQPALAAERALSDAQYHRKDQPLETDQATELNGSLTSNENAAFNKSVIINGTLEGDGTVRAKPGQEILIPEQGDISMGEFRAGAQPVIAP